MTSSSMSALLALYGRKRCNAKPINASNALICPCCTSESQRFAKDAGVFVDAAKRRFLTTKPLKKYERFTALAELPTQVAATRLGHGD